MSGVRSLYRGSAAKGYASAASAPIRVDSSANTIKSIVAGTGTTEVEFLSTTPAPVVVPGATLTLAPVTHGGRTVVFTSLSGCTVTLPAAVGNGATYMLVIGASLTSGSFILQVANANDYMRGQASTIGSSGITIGLTANTGTVSTESDTVTWNRTTTGLGTIGDKLVLLDMAANIWQLEAIYASSGAAASPFSAAV